MTHANEELKQQQIRTTLWHNANPNSRGNLGCEQPKSGNMLWMVFDYFCYHRFGLLLDTAVNIIIF